MCDLTASEEISPVPSEDDTPLVKKYFISNTPRGEPMYFTEGLLYYDGMYYGDFELEHITND